MLRNKLVRSDGSIIDSSVIISCDFTEGVNSNTNLSVGDATSSELTVEILSTTPIQQGEMLTYYIIEDGVETKIGIFNAEKPTLATRTTMRFLAYDNVIRTEKLFSDWLRGNQSTFPMALSDLVQAACSHCDVALVDATLPNASLLINAFYADNLTCRQVLMWAGAIMGRFIRANADGEIEFAWYRPDTNIRITPSKTNNDPNLVVLDDGKGNLSVTSDKLSVVDDGLGNITMSADGLEVMTNDAGVSLASSIVVPFRRDGLSYESYATDLIERVQINHSEDDVGIIYPVEATGNCFTISNNMILGTCSSEQVLEVATSLHEHLKDITYVPFSVTVGRTIRIRAGDIVSITDSAGHVFTSYVMNVSLTPSGTTLSATGDKSYDSEAAVSSEKHSNLTGKVLSIQQSIDGLKIRNEDLEGKVSGLELTTESFKTYVEETFISNDEFHRYRTEAEQTAEGFEQRFERVEGDIRETNAHINSGLLGNTDAGDPIYGIEVGQRNLIDGVETFDKYARFTADRLSFYDANNTEVSYIGDYKQVITNAEVLDTFKVGKFVFDTSNGLALRWEE